jgi:hypothetical protein
MQLIHGPANRTDRNASGHTGLSAAFPGSALAVRTLFSLIRPCISRLVHTLQEFVGANSKFVDFWLTNFIKYLVVTDYRLAIELEANI